MSTGLACIDAGQRTAFIEQSPPTAVPGACGIVWVEGRDAAGFLQGLLSNDIAGLEAGGSIPALLLTTHGHLEAMMQVHRDTADAFTLVSTPGLAPRIAERLTELQHSEDLDVLGPETAPCITVMGDPAPRGGVVVDGPFPGAMTMVVDDAEAALEALGATPGAPELIEVLRIERGQPEVGVDTTATTLVHEVGLQDAAVSFTKGCYLGQETVARTQHRGRVNRLLRGLAGEARPGASVSVDGREVGTVTSAATSPVFGPIALAMLRREVAPGDRVEVAGHGPATVRALPFE